MSETMVIGDHDNGSVVRETPINDIIFSMGNGNSTEYTSGDLNYINPDYKKYYFSTFDSNTKVVYKNGMVSPIKQHPNLRGYLGEERLKKMFGNKGYTRGVLIVEYFNIIGTSNIAQAENIINHYLYNENIIYNDETKLAIRETLLANKTKRGYNDTKIRIISFIPEDQIKNNQSVYHIDTDSMIIYGNVNEHHIHPKGKKFVNEKKPDLKIDTNIVMVDIIDDTVKPYFIKIGNTVEKVLSRTSTTKSNRVKVNIMRRGVVVKTHKSYIKDMKELGIYTSQEECEINGDIKTELEKEKINVTKAQLEVDKNNLLMSSFTSVYKNDSDIKLQDSKLSFAKFDLHKKKTEHNFNMEAMIVKHSVEMDKLNVDLKKSQLDSTTKAIGSMSQLGKLLLG